MFKEIRSKDETADQIGSNFLPILRMYNYEQSNDPDEGRIRPSELKKME